MLVAEERRRILALVGQLPPVQQDALSLRFAAGLSSREIGAVIGKTEADVGYTIVLEKAAIDSERRWVALTLSGAPALADLGEMQVTDANGVVLTAGTGAGTGDVAGESATIFGFAIPDDSELHGPFTLEVKNVFGPDGLVPGRWAFTFDLPTADGG